MKEQKNYKKFTEEKNETGTYNPTNLTEQDEILKLKFGEEIQQLKKEFNYKLEKLQEENAQIKEILSKSKEIEDIEKGDPKNLISKKSLEKIKEFEEHHHNDIFKEEIDCDSYLYFSVVLSYNTIPLLARFLFQGLCNCKIACCPKILMILSIFFSPLLFIPGILTPFIQTVGFISVLQAAVKNFKMHNEENIILIKVLVLFIFVSMIIKEASQALNAMFFLYTESRIKWKYFFYGCFLPQLLQLFMTFLLLYVSVLLILSSEDSIDLIQNFAALYILLEIDNIVMEFMRLTKLNMILLKINLGLHIIRKKLETPAILNNLLIQKVLTNKDIEFNLKEKSGTSKFFFVLLRVLIVLVFIVLAGYTYIDKLDDPKETLIKKK